MTIIARISVFFRRNMWRLGYRLGFIHGFIATYCGEAMNHELECMDERFESGVFLPLLALRSALWGFAMAVVPSWRSR